MTVIEQRFMDAVISINRTLQDRAKESKTIDWEQRRYELIKDFYAARIGRSANYQTEEELMRQSILDADKVIAILKGKGE